MNAYVDNTMARDHVDALVAAAVASRRAKLARLSRRARRTPFTPAAGKQHAEE
jgi:hypothetical protein